MAEEQTRRRFTAEFKAEAVKRLLEGGKSLSEVATGLGLSPGQLSGGGTSTWRGRSAEELAARKVKQAEMQHQLRPPDPARAWRSGPCQPRELALLLGAEGTDPDRHGWPP